MSSTVTEKYHHGKTPAAWTAVTIIMIASVVSTVGIIERGPDGEADCVVEHGESLWRS